MDDADRFRPKEIAPAIFQSATEDLGRYDIATEPEAILML